jgi:hypothetical protein
MNTRRDPEGFVARFADFWTRPSPQRLPELLHPDGDVIESPVVNRLLLDKGKAIEGATYFDPLVIAPTLLRRPSR